MHLLHFMQECEPRFLRRAENENQLFIDYHESSMRIPDDADQRSGMMPITIPF